jgi:SAM-dependent methyltransferase
MAVHASHGDMMRGTSDVGPVAILGASAGRLERAARLVGYSSAKRYRVRGDFVFRGVPLTGAHVLDVGCGVGAWAIWAALHGAARVVGIEPGAEGSSANTLAACRRAIADLGLGGTVVATDQYLQQLPIPERPFDVVVLYNVVNHLDEEAVVALHRDRAAAARYVTVLERLRSMVRLGGWVIVADAARDNLWRRLGLRSPLARSIEWEKHQDPSTWIRLFERAGFELADLRWSPLQPFVRLTANRLAQYVTASHFVLRVRAAELPRDEPGRGSPSVGVGP